MRVLGIITARGGSKGIPGKNLKLLGGKPLLHYSIEAANDTPLDRLILSTEDQKIAEVARSLGCEVPFMRPAELARDETPHLPVIQHAARWLLEHQNYKADVVLILQPTSPLRSSADIAAALRMLELSGADSVVSVNEVSAHAHPMRMLRVDDQGNAVLFAAEPSLYGDRVVAYPMPAERSISIDDQEDWAEAERALARRPPDHHHDH